MHMFGVNRRKLFCGRTMKRNYENIIPVSLSVSVRSRLRRSSGPDGVNWRPPPSFSLLLSWL